MTKRLFIFAAYDKHSVIDDYVIHYLRALSEFGDIIFIMDNDASESELGKLRAVPNILHIEAARHGSYDFGSYKRGYQWAERAGILKNYDFMYLANDSVFGPVYPLGPVLEKLENAGADYFGFLCNDVGEEYIQSWFVGMRQKIFTHDWYSKFIDGIRPQKNKHDYVLKYEIGQSVIIDLIGGTYYCWTGTKFITACKVFRALPEILDCGVPFIKKLCFFDSEYAEDLPRRQKALKMLGSADRDRIVKYLSRFGLGDVLHQKKARKRKNFALNIVRVWENDKNKLIIELFGLRIFWLRRKGRP